MPDTAVVYLPLYLTLAVLNILFAGVLFGVWRVLRRPFLLRWCMSWAALSVYHLLAALTMGSPPQVLAATHPLRLATSLLAQLSGYLQPLLLWWGMWQFATGRELSTRVRGVVAAALLVMAGMVTVATLPAPLSLRLLVRVGIRAALCGAVFLGVGFWLLRRRDASFGRRLLAVAMMVQGGQELHYFTVMLLPALGAEWPGHLHYLAYLDFVTHGAIGLGMVIWLFEAERRRAEEAQATLQHNEAQLRQSAKMEAIGRMAGGLAHDFNNLLTGLTGFSEMLLRNLGPEHPARGDAQHIRRLVDRATTLTRQLLAFSRKQVLSPRVIQPNTVVTEMESLLRRLIGEHVQLVTRTDASVGHVRVDPGQLEQVLVNLAVNARDAMPAGGRLTIATRWADAAELARLPLEGEAARARWIVVSVQDTGLGMSPQTKARLFEPFFTTKGPGRGTGLGLSSVYGIVRQSQGHILVESEPGCGALFLIFLPHVAADAQPPTDRVPAPIPLRAARGHVLLVEDEGPVLELATRVLRAAGFTVTPASHGEEALDRASSLGHIDLLLTDVIMPHLGGRELAERLRQRWPSLRVLFMSGYVADAELRLSVGQTAAAFLEKPFSPETLLRKVLDALAVGAAAPGASG